MESFVTSLDNPAYREQLSRALTMGKGVFRAFKDALKGSKEIEKLWFAYKEQRLRGVIMSWYNANREARGLARLPVEPEETEELVMSDFSVCLGSRTARRRRPSPGPGRILRALPGQAAGAPAGEVRGEAQRDAGARHKGGSRSTLQRLPTGSLPASSGASSTGEPSASSSLQSCPHCAGSG